MAGELEVARKHVQCAHSSSGSRPTSSRPQERGRQRAERPITEVFAARSELLSAAATRTPRAAGTACHRLLLELDLPLLDAEPVGGRGGCFDDGREPPGILELGLGGLVSTGRP